MSIKTSSAADCMAILGNTTRNGNKETGGAFADLFAQASNYGKGYTEQIAQGDLLQSNVRFTSISTTTFTDHVRSAATETTAWRNSDAYTQFRDNYLNPAELEYTDDMFDVDDYGNKTLNAKGRDQLNKWQIDNLSPMTPDSVKDARDKFAAAYEHLNNYIHTMFEDRGIEMQFDYQPQTGINGKSNFIGATIPKPGPDADAQLQKYYDYMNSADGKEMQVMAEEVQFYGAIAQLAEASSDFRDKYNADPDAAIGEYYNRIADTMKNIRMPKVQTIPGYQVQLAGFFR